MSVFFASTDIIPVGSVSELLFFAAVKLKHLSGLLFPAKLWVAVPRLRERLSKVLLPKLLVPPISRSPPRLRVEAIVEVSTSILPNRSRSLLTVVFSEVKVRAPLPLKCKVR